MVVKGKKWRRKRVRVWRQFEGSSEIMEARLWCATVKGRGRQLEDEEERGGGRRAVVDEEGDREEVGGMQT
ncbi:hypothetical protein HAX54_025095, partial [Datura stramonium]|nr:hypothetical protein [Datura stramonium]